MNHLRLLFTLALFVCTGFSSHAQQQSLLWQVSGKGLTKPSYIYGTIHVICAADFEMKDKVSKAFDQSTTLVVEADISDPNEMKIAQEMMRSETKLSSSLTTEEQQQLDSLLKQHFNLSMTQVDNLSPVALESMIILKSVTCSDRKMYELEFIQKAKQQNKPVKALESMKEQIEILESAIPAKELIKHLQYVPENTSLFNQLVSAYKKEDLEVLLSFALDKRFMTDSARKMLLDERNEKWIKIMPAMMKDNSTFFAVGAIHLAGEKGLLELLNKEGYTISPVLN